MQDDAGAADNDEPREDREEEERLIQEMLDKAAADARAAKATLDAARAAEEAGEDMSGQGTFCVCVGGGVRWGEGCTCTRQTGYPRCT